MVSVLLDAGAGAKWSYRSKQSGKVYARSEGLAVASLEMFKSGLFSSDPTEPCQVDGAGLKKLTVEKLAKGMQHSESNPLAGIEGRAGLLARLAEALNHQDFFGVDARPGNMLGRRDLVVLESSLISNHISEQITCSGTHRHSLLPCQSSQSLRSGPSSWTALLPSGRLRGHRLTV